MIGTCKRCGIRLLIGVHGYPHYCRPCQHAMIATFARTIEEVAKPVIEPATTKE